MTAPGPDLLNTTQAAARAGVTERTMRKWIAAGRVGTQDGPEGRRVDRASLDAYRVARAKQAGNGAGPGAVARADPGPDIGAELLTEVRALRKELAELRAALPPPQEAARKAGVVRPDDPTEAPPGGLWARVGRWWRGGGNA